MFFQTPDKVINYYITHRQTREDQILQVLKTSNQAISSADIVKILYPVSIDNSLNSSYFNTFLIVFKTTNTNFSII